MASYGVGVPDDVCPVPESVFGQLYRAHSQGLPQLVESIPAHTRAMLALFCYRRSHLQDLAISIAEDRSRGGIVGGGFFDLSDGGATLLQADFLAAWNGSHWSALGDEPNGALVNGYASSAVYAVLVNGTDVYVGGYFENVSNHGVNLPAADYVAKWDGTNWSPVASSPRSSRWYLPRRSR